MSIIQSIGGGLGGAGAPGGPLGSFYSHTLDQSLRFDNESTSSYLEFTPAAEGNRDTWTISMWVKRAELGTTNKLFGAGSTFASNHNNSFYMWFQSDDTLRIRNETSGSYYTRLDTTRVFRDVGSWYHIVYIYDSSQSTSTDRQKLYINGVQETVFDHRTDPSSNQNSKVNDTHVHLFGKTTSSTLNAYLAEINFLDGLAYDSSYFGETKDGVWVAKEYAGSYGQNGFRLSFPDSNYIGRDKSGSKTLVTSPSFSTFGGGDTNFTSAEYAEAFDNILSTDCDRTGSGGIIDITPSSSVTPVSHTMINASSSAYTAASRPNSVLLQGSNDGGSNWTTIDDLTNGSGSNTITTSSFSNTTSYAKLRLNISENHGGSNTRFAQYIVIASEDNGDGENIFFNTNLAATDVVPDSPTNNFATLNSIEKDVGATFTEGNLEVTTGAGFDLIRSTFFVSSGKWYWEVRATDCGTGFIGVSTASDTGRGGQDSNQSAMLTTSNGNIRTNATSSSYGNSVSDGDIIGVALDMDNGKLYFAENNTYYNSGDPANQTNPAVTGLTTEVSPSISLYDAEDYNINFGQDSTFAGLETAGGNADANGIGNFKYAPPSGFLALCTSNLPDPTIGPGQSKQADDHFNTVLYTGNNSASRGITGVGFQPDFVWTKSRNTTSYHHQFHNSVRGASAGALYPSLTNAEDSSYPISSFDSDGFTTTSGSQNGQNTSHTYVGWFWKAGTAFSNDASATGVGTLDSTGSVNQAAGFSIISYTGTIQSGETIAHGLGGVPEMIWAKNRDNSANWVVYTKDLTSEYTLYFNTSGGENNSATTWGSHTATVFGVDDDPQSNPNGDATIAYLFRSIEGYSKIGSFVGNSSSDGTFVNLGFRPAWVMIKSTSSGTNWSIFDNKRLGYNVDNNIMRIGANESSQEQTDDDVDFVSNGLKFRRSSTNFNNSSHTYIYLAFAEAPFKFANAR